MAMSEDHASCCVHKDLTVTTKQIRALPTQVLTAAGLGRQADRKNVKYDWQVSSGNTARLDGHKNQHIRRLRLPWHSLSG